MERFDNDHDLLITVNTKLDSVIDTVNELKNNIITRVDKLEKTYVDSCEIDKLNTERTTKWNTYDHRLDKLENWRSYIVGILSLMGVVATLITYIYFIQYNSLKESMGEVSKLLEKHVEK